MSPVKTPFTLCDYIPKGFFDSGSSDDDPAEGEAAQFCMVSCTDECEEVNVKHANTAHEVHQVTLWSGHQLHPLESMGKEKKKEMRPEITLIWPMLKKKVKRK